jgi:hypothetical protein
MDENAVTQELRLYCDSGFVEPMAFRQLSKSDERAILDCMKFVAESSCIEDWEFQTRLGISRDALKRIISAFPAIDDSANSDGFLAINNCLNEVCHGVAISPTDWSVWSSQSVTKIGEAYRNWLKAHGKSRSGIC